MRQFNRILGFVAVSFVLVFLGRVNKVGLYTAYFKTIADVEIRNSTALAHGDTQLLAVNTTPSVQHISVPTVSGHGALVDGVFLTLAPVIQHDLQAAPSVAGLGMQACTEIAPRAPCA